jgi:hypothetical protein
MRDRTNSRFVKSRTWRVPPHGGGSSRRPVSFTFVSHSIGAAAIRPHSRSRRMHKCLWSPDIAEWADMAPSRRSKIHSYLPS